MNFVRTIGILFAVANIATSQPFIPIAETNDPPPSYTLGWTPGPTNATPVDGFTIKTNGVILADTVATNFTIFDPIGPVITNEVASHGFPPGSTNRLTSPFVAVIWTNVFFIKPQTNIITIAGRFTASRPAQPSATAGLAVTNWPPVILTNPPTIGAALFWIPQTTTTNAQAIECRTGSALPKNLILDGQTFAPWQPFIGRGFYWVAITSTNI